MKPNSRNRRTNTTNQAFAIEALEERTVLSVTPLGEELRVDFAIEAVDLSTPPRVLLNQDGTGHVVWIGSGNDTSYIVRQSVNSDGEPVGAPMPMEFMEQGTWADGDIDAAGNLTLVWTGPLGSGDVFVQQFDASGRALGDVLQIQDGDGAIVTLCSVDVNSHGDAVIAYNRRNDIAVWKLSADGVLQELDGPGTNGSLSIVPTDVGIADDGSATVFWSTGVPGQNEIRYLFQQYTEAGIAIGGVTEVSTATYVTSQYVSNELPWHLPDMHMNGGGQFVVTWSQQEPNLGDPLLYDDIFARVYDSDGTPMSESFRVNADTVGYQYAPRASISDSEVVITWGTPDDAAGNVGIYARKFALDGTPLTGDIAIPASLGVEHVISDVVISDAGDFLVTWGLNGLASPPASVNAQWYDAAGVAATPAFRVDPPLTPVSIEYETNYITSPGPQTAVNAAGDTVVTWYGEDDGYIQVYRANGDALALIGIENISGGRVFFTDVAIAEDGDFVVIWGEDEEQLGLTAYAQRFHIDGTKLGGVVTIPQLHPQDGKTIIAASVAMDGAGNAIVASVEDVGEQVLVLHRMDTEGAFIGNGLTVLFTPGDGVQFSLVANDAGDVVMSWVNQSHVVRAITLDADNNIVSNNVVIGSMPTLQTLLGDSMVAIDDNGDFAVVWGNTQTQVLELRRYSQTGGSLGIVTLGSFDSQVLRKGITRVAPGEFVVLWTDFGGSHLQHVSYDGPIGDGLDLDVLNYRLSTGSAHRFAVTSVREVIGVPGLFVQNFTVNDAPDLELVLPTLGLRSDGGAGHAVRGQEIEIELVATDPWSSDPAADFIFRIDWDNDGEFDEVVTGPSGMKVSRLFTEAGEYVIGVQVEDIDGGVSETVMANLIITDWDKRQDEDDPSTVHLVVGGTMGNDAFAFLPGYMLTQLENNTYFPTPRSTAVGSFNGQIHVYAQAGDDLILGQVMSSPMVVYGGEGNDLLVGGRGSDSLFGGVGDDMIFGGTMESDLGDWLEGGDGNDLLFGWLGGDTVTGGDGEDLIVAGSLDFEDLPEAIYSIQSEWLAPRPQQQRIANLSGTGTGERFNNDFFLTPSQTVLDDAAVDLIHGGLLQSDWVLSGEADLVTGNPQPLTQVGEEVRADATVIPFSFDLPPIAKTFADGSSEILWFGTGDSTSPLVIRQRLNESGEIVGGPVIYEIPQTNNVFMFDVDSDASGNVVMVWSELNGRRVYLARFDATGERIGNIEIVVDSGSNNPFVTLCAVDVNEQGNAVVSWNQKNGLFFRLIASNGQMGEIESAVIVPTSSNVFASDVAMDESGNFVMIWSDPMASSPGTFLIWAQRFNAAGDTVGTAIEVGTGSPRESTEFFEGIQFPRVAISTSGRFVVTWYSFEDGESSTYQEVLVRAFDASGVAVTGVLAVADGPRTFEHGVYADVNDDGSFVVSWSRSNFEGNLPGVYAKAFDVDGTPLTGEVTLTEGSDAEHKVSSIALAADGDYLVVWGENSQSDDPHPLYATWISAGGEPIGEEVYVDGTPQTLGNVSIFYPGYEDLLPGPQSAINANGDQVVTWFNNNGVFAQVYTADGNMLPRVDVKVKESRFDGAAFVDVAIAADGSFVVTWWEVPDNQPERHLARRYALDGTPLGSEIELPKSYNSISSLIEVGMDGAGNAVFVRAESGHLMLHRIDTNGDLTGSPLDVVSGTNLASFSSSVNSAGEVVISWTEEMGITRRLWAAKVDATNNILANAILVAENLPNVTRPGLTTAALAEDGSFVLTWETGPLPGGSQILARRYDTAGNPLGDAFIIRESQEQLLSRPAITFVASRAYVVSWREAGSIYLQQFVGEQAVGEPVSVAAGLVYSMTSGHSGDVLLTVVRPTQISNDAGVFVTRWSTGPALTENAVDDLLADDDLELALAGLQEGLL